MSAKIVAAMSQMYTALPAKIDSYDPETRTISATPLIRRTFEDEIQTQTLSIDDIPVVFPSGGGGEVTFPLQIGDQVLLIFSMRSIQDWLVSQTGDEVSPVRKKTHTVQDAIAIPSLFTKPQARAANADHMELLFGESKIQIQEDSKIVIESGTVELGEGAAESAILGNTFQSIFNAHTHPVPSLGISATPSVPLTGTELATQVKVK